MKFGLKSYETTQRLLWLLLLLICLALAYPVATAYRTLFSSIQVYEPVEIGMIKTIDFWTRQHWIQFGPIGMVLVYLVWAGIIFWAVRLVWLLFQYLAIYVVIPFLNGAIKVAEGVSEQTLSDQDSDTKVSTAAAQLVRKMGRVPFKFLFHPFLRLQVMLANPEAMLSSDLLMDRQRRMVEMDYQLFWGVWTPFRLLLAVLPLLALVQASWLFYVQVQPVLAGQTQVEEVLNIFLGCVLPVVQVIVVTIGLHVAYGVIRRLEGLYLSGVGAVFYDRFLSRLPFHNADTALILDALKHHIEELQTSIRRIEESLRIQKHLSVE